MRPILCKKCAYESLDKEKPTILICKMCRVTEKMRGFSVEAAGIKEDEFKESGHTIKMVASVSYDRTKKQFNYDNFTGNAFEGAENIEEMKRRQETTLARARERFDGE